MGNNIQAVRGMKDILPPETLFWQQLEQVLRDVAMRYGYQELRLPLVEYTELFTRTIGEATDIVEKEMYTFLDRNCESLTLRPEGTASCVRAGILHGLLYNQMQRLFYLGPMFRHERPQKGRYRQFCQFGIEAFGMPGPDIDAELLLLAYQMWEVLGIKDKVTLQLNSLGNSVTRAKYREKLVAYFTKYEHDLDLDSQRRLKTNPLRILDSKNTKMQPLIETAPVIVDYLDAEARAHFEGLQTILDTVGLKYELNPRLVRGLDYYCLTVFEWVTHELGAQNAICAGGHYDNLVAELGGKATPAIGYALGLERLLELVRDSFVVAKLPVVYLVLLGEAAVLAGFNLALELRRTVPQMSLVMNTGGGDLTTQLRRADKKGAEIALILGSEELAQQVITVKYLRADVPQSQVLLTDVGQLLMRKTNE